MNFKLMDLHNHSIWSQGVNTLDEIVDNAIAKGIEIVGISDYLEKSNCPSIMLEHLHVYIDHVNRLKDEYKEVIDIQTGIEISLEKGESLVDKLNYKELNKLDFILFQGLDSLESDINLESFKEIRKGLNCKVGLANTTYINIKEKFGIDNLINFMKEENIFWEFNIQNILSGKNTFTSMIKDIEFMYFTNILKKNNIEIMVGSDNYDLDLYNVDIIEEGNIIAKELLEA